MPCKPENKSYVDSYEVTLDRVKVDNPSLSDHEVKVQAALSFRPYYRRIRETAQVEAKGGEKYENGEFTLTSDGKMYFLKEHQTAEQLNLNQLRLSQLPGHTASEYSLSDHQTTLLIQEAFKNGSHQVVTSFGNRDVLEYLYNPMTKRGTIRIHNTAVDKNYHLSHEIQTIAKNTFVELHETKISKNIFVLSDKPLDESKVRQTFVRLEKQVSHAVNEAIITVSKNTIQEMKQTAISIEGYIKRKRDVSLKEIPIMVGDTLIHRVRRMFEQKDNRKDDKSVVKEINLIGRSQEKEKNTQTKIWEKIIAPVATLLFVRATGIGIGGTFVSFESLVRLPQISLESPKRIRKEKLKQRKQILEKMRTFRMNESFKKLTKKEWRAFRRKEKTLRVHEIKLSQSKERRKIRREEMLFRKKEKKILLRKERKIMRRKEILLWKTLKRLVQKTERSVVSKKIKQKEKLQKITVVKKEIRQTKKQEKQHVIKFSIAVVLWLLMRPPEKRRDVKVTTHEKLTKLVQKEPAPWLLLAIIWHLAMIREGGNRTVYKQKKAKKQARQYYSAFIPPQGVIFTFAS